jgi:hypothetical protein
MADASPLPDSQQKNLRGALAEAERRSLEAELAELRESSAARVAELEEEVEALLADGREAAIAVYRARIDRAVEALSRAEAHRRDLEGLFLRTTDASEVDRARDAAVLRAAIEREEQERRRLTEAQTRLAKLGG